MKKTIKELEINGRKYAYVVSELGGEQRFFVMILKEYGCEDYCTANGYGIKCIEAAGRVFDNRLFFAEHYEVNDDEPCRIVPPDYLIQMEKLKRFRK
jgi:hypothetical protein